MMMIRKAQKGSSSFKRKSYSFQCYLPWGVAGGAGCLLTCARVTLTKESLCTYVFSTRKPPESQPLGHVHPYKPKRAISYKAYILKPTHMPLKKQFGTKNQMTHHCAERTNRGLCFLPPLLCLLILSLVLKTSWFPQRKDRFATFHRDTFHRFASFAFKRESSYHLGLVLKASSSEQEECNFQGFYLLP